MNVQKPTILEGGALDQPKRAAPPAFDSVVLERLINEVRVADVELPGRYNRMHNRHNRN